MADEELQAWEQQKGEPNLWYDRFANFYLTMPRSRRSLEGAYKRLCEAENRSPNVRSPDMEKWRAMSKQWKWIERAAAWDLTQDNNALPTLEEAEQLIRLSSIDAVLVLLKAVGGAFGPKYQMMAAKDILDRAGIVKPNEKEPAGGIVITADVLAELSKKAQMELAEWEAQRESQTPTDEPS